LLAGLPVEIVDGDLTDAASLRPILKGCGCLFHVAAFYSLWARDRRLFYDINLEGTQRILQAAGEAAVTRVVYTSTVGALGIPPGGGAGTEETPVSLTDMVGDYKRSKFLAEEVARGFARQGLPVVIVNPSTPVGAGDIKPTPTGQMIVDFLRGRMWAYLPTGLNLVDVDDVAAGHLLAAERGRAGERYILGGENLPHRQIAATVAAVAGVRAPRLVAPRGLLGPAAVVVDGFSRVSPVALPINGEQLRLSGVDFYFDSSKAVRELGYPIMPFRAAVEKAHRWYREHGYL
jgi:dihydroflavonol-4-reductase